MPRKTLTRRQQALPSALRDTGFISPADELVGVSRELHYNALRVSPVYRRAFAAIQKHLSEAAFRRMHCWQLWASSDWTSNSN